jgi:hypothetical protein
MVSLRKGSKTFYLPYFPHISRGISLNFLAAPSTPVTHNGEAEEPEEFPLQGGEFADDCLRFGTQRLERVSLDRLEDIE